MSPDVRAPEGFDSSGVDPLAPPLFRRRAFRNTLLVLLGFALGAGWILATTQPRATLEDRIRDARGSEPGVVYQIENMSATLVKVADLGDKVGIGLIIGQPAGAQQRSTGRDSFRLEIHAENGIVIVYGSDDGGAREAWEEIVVPPDGQIVVDVHRQCVPLTSAGLPTSGFCSMLPPLKDPIGSFVIDFRALHIPESIWH